MNVKCVLPAAADLGENALWLAQQKRLFWLDLNAPAVHSFNPQSRENLTLALALNGRIACLVQNAESGFLLATSDNIYRFDTATLQLKHFLSLPGDPARIRFNDGKIDRQGRFWIGTSDINEKQALGALYRIDNDASLHCIDKGFVVSNGPAFSPNGERLYFADTFSRIIYSYDINSATGAADNRRIFARLAPEHGYPDGLTVDADGFIWSTHWDGWRITRYAPDGQIDKIIQLPVPRVTSCCFGGEDMQTLFITTARTGLDLKTLEKAPLAGSIFALKTDTTGILESTYNSKKA